MDGAQGFMAGKPICTVMPTTTPQYVLSIKLSTELLEHLQSQGAAGAAKTIYFSRDGTDNIISLGNEHFSFKSNRENVVNDCYHEVAEDKGPVFRKVGMVKRKIFVTQKLREEDRKRVKNATEIHEKERKSHKSVLLDDPFAKEGKKRKAPSVSSAKSLPLKRNRTLEPSGKPPPASLSSLAAKHVTTGTATTPTALRSPKRVPLRTQIVQMLALEPLSYEQIEPKCTASKTALASTLQQVAKMKDGLYHLKKHMYNEVDTNWSNYTSEDRQKVLERKNHAMKSKKEKGPTTGDTTASELAKAGGTRHIRPLANGMVLSERTKVSSPPEEHNSTNQKGNGLGDRHKEHQTKSVALSREMEAKSSPPSREKSVPAKVTVEVISEEEYKTRRAEWEKKYKEYCDLHRQLSDNAQFFQALGSRLKKASEPEKVTIVQRITNDYKKRISKVKQMRKRLSFLHAEIKEEKAFLLTHGSHRHCRATAKVKTC